MMTEEGKKQNLSRAYVKAVSSIAGVQTNQPDDDYFDIDLTISGSNGSIDVQLKSTSKAKVYDDYISYDLEVSDYKSLINSNRLSPIYLVVLLIDNDIENCFIQDSEHLILKKCAYYMNLQGKNPVDNISTIAIRIPKSQMLNPDALSNILKQPLEGFGVDDESQ